mgnify:CR=1 FL=1
MRNGSKQEARRRNGAYIRVARDLLCETQEAFARRLGTTQRNISFYEDGTLYTPLDILEECENIVMDGGR